VFLERAKKYEISALFLKEKCVDRNIVFFTSIQKKKNRRSTEK
jgi:hypothetical protein